MATYTKDNRLEIPDQTPVEMPLGYERPESLEQMIARMVRFQSDKAQRHGLESFEEADDFDVADSEGDLMSPYQMTDMQEEEPPYVRQQPQTRHDRRESDKAVAKAKEAEKPQEPHKEDTARPEKTVVKAGAA